MKTGAKIGLGVGIAAAVLCMGGTGLVGLAALGDTPSTTGSLEPAVSHSAVTDVRDKYVPGKDVKLVGIKHQQDLGRYVAVVVTNHGTDEQNYSIDVGQYNAAGKRVGETYLEVDNVSPKETVNSGFENGGMIDQTGVKTVKILQVTVLPS